MIRQLWRWLRYSYYILSVPISIFFILNSYRIHPAYRMNWLRKFSLGLRMFWNSLLIPTASSYKAHLAMALKILETPPEIPGVIVECGCWRGGSSANLSLICRAVNRKLIIFDSFQGLPQPDPKDREAPNYQKGNFCGTLTEVRHHIEHFGAIECCEFAEGWFDQTLPNFQQTVLLAWLDVDLEKSLEICVRYLWPQMVAGGYLFMDECVNLNLCALFWSERWWSSRFGHPPPGLIGAGTGLALGDYYIGPLDEREAHPLQHPGTGAWTRKGWNAYWLTDFTRL